MIMLIIKINNLGNCHVFLYSSMEFLFFFSSGICFMTLHGFSLFFNKSLPPLLPFPFYFLLLSYSSPFFFPLYVGRYSSTRLATLASLLCVCPLSIVLCRSSHPWPLLRLAGCLIVFFVLNKRLLLSISSLMSVDE
jgi:hypothetical protein